MELINPFEPVSKGIESPSVTRVRALVATGAHVGHGRDLVHVTNSRGKGGKATALQRYTTKPRGQRQGPFGKSAAGTLKRTGRRAAAFVQDHPVGSGAAAGVAVGAPFFPGGYREGKRSVRAGERASIPRSFQPGYGWGRALGGKKPGTGKVEKSVARGLQMAGNTTRPGALGGGIPKTGKTAARVVRGNMLRSSAERASGISTDVGRGNNVVSQLRSGLNFQSPSSTGRRVR